ncbi:helix-turn-helix domain-containing protein [Paraburkholderia xenovorans]|uniref:helix-turn-helix domain-containing protein n=1 Tax=Paraburkholderia xenovorans TaxID=36873 RepID=UPI0003244BC3|nr:helix-turn-helix domain-containing protein [Paraburkholderia xenovorans]
MKLANKECQKRLSLIARKTACAAGCDAGAHPRCGLTTVIPNGHWKERGSSVQTVCLWRRRTARQAAQGIPESERSGRPPRITHEARLQLIALACEAQESDRWVTPTLNEIAARAVKRGGVGQIRRSHVQRILQVGDLPPHRVQQWLHTQSGPKLSREGPRHCVCIAGCRETLSSSASTRRPAFRAVSPSIRDERPRQDGCIAMSSNIYSSRHIGVDCRAGCTYRKSAAQCERRAQDDLIALMERVAIAYRGKQPHVVWDTLNTHRARAV